MTLPAKEKFRCDLLSWGSVIRNSKNLAWMVRNSGYAPDIIVAIGRGGYVPARILCDYLLIHDLVSIKVEHWGSSVVQGEAFIKFALRADIRNKQVLLVDDITDTGDTLKVSLQYLKRFRPSEIRTAILVHKTRSTIVPDYFVKKIVKWRWVIFPWHQMEDLSAFIKKLQEEGICSESDLQTSLKQRYDMDIPMDKIREVLSIIG
jgi:hypoxanthine phosphoribosyltransferase